MLDDAKGIYKDGVSDIGSDGSLSKEMRRALDAPCTITTFLTGAAGADRGNVALRRRGLVRAFKDNRINLLAERVADGYVDPSWFIKESGTDPAGHPGQR